MIIPLSLSQNRRYVTIPVTISLGCIALYIYTTDILMTDYDCMDNQCS